MIGFWLLILHFLTVWTDFSTSLAQVRAQQELEIKAQTIKVEAPKPIAYPDIKVARIYEKSSAQQVLLMDNISQRWKWRESKSLFKITPYLVVESDLKPFGFIEPLIIKQSKFNKTSVQGSRLQFIASQTQGQIVISTHDKKGKPLDVTLQIQVRSLQPSLLVHKTCDKLGMNLAESKAAKGFLFVAIVCKKGKRGVHVVMEQDPLATLTGMIPAGKSRNNRSVHFFRQPPAATDEAGRVVVANWQVSAQSSGSYQMVMTDLSHKRLAVTAGIGPTLISHSETLGGLKVTEIAMSGKVAGTYILIPDLMDVGMSVFGTLLPLTTSPSTLPSARWIGLNARVGIMLPIDWWDARWSILTGVYYWSMIVPNQAYGLSAAQGPQIFLTVSRFKRTVKKKAFVAYLKIAPMLSDGSGLGFKNIDLALGGAYQINNIKSKTPLLLSFDIDHLRVTSVAAGNTVSTLSITTGLSFSLF